MLMFFALKIAFFFGFLDFLQSAILIVFIFRLPTIQQEVQQRKMLYMGLYLLIWGEAANLRFMPECLCYIYHHVWILLILFKIRYNCEQSFVNFLRSVFVFGPSLLPLSTSVLESLFFCCNFILCKELEVLPII